MGTNRWIRGRSSRQVRAVGIAVALLLGSGPLLQPAAAEPEDIEGSIEIAAPIEIVWRVLTDFRSWPSFVPGLKRIAVVEHAASELALRHETERVGMAIDFTALMRVQAELHRVELLLDESASNDLAAMRASWQLTPLASGRVRVEFHSAIDSGQPVPAFIQRRLLRESVAETIERFSSEVERRVGVGEATPGV
jgi:carbon monoxide dehydrogenase subunit G